MHSTIIVLLALTVINISFCFNIKTENTTTTVHHHHSKQTTPTVDASTPTISTTSKSIHNHANNSHHITSTSNWTTPSPSSQANHEPKTPNGFGKISSDELNAIKVLCANNRCLMNQSEAILNRRSYVKQIWVNLLKQTPPFKGKPSKMAEQKAETFMRKAYIAKSILLQSFGISPEIAKPTDDGIFEGDVLLPDYITNRIIIDAVHLNRTEESKAQIQAAIDSLLSDNYQITDRYVTCDMCYGVCQGILVLTINCTVCMASCNRAATGNISDAQQASIAKHPNKSSSQATAQHASTDASLKSAIDIDQYQSLAWSSSVFYHIDQSVDKHFANVVHEAFDDISNITACMKFIERPTVSDYEFQQTIIIYSMPPVPSNITLDKPICLLSSLGRLPLNFVFVNFSCPSYKGELLHGIMHTLGVVHEHNRLDRNDFLTIQWSKLSPEFIEYFIMDQPLYTSTFGIPFDYDSLMSYNASIGAAKPGDFGMIAKVSNATSALGQRQRLSCPDAEMLKQMYCCPAACQDHQSECGYFSNVGQCESKESWFWMQNKCEKSCRHCCAEVGCAPMCSHFCSTGRWEEHEHEYGHRPWGNHWGNDHHNWGYEHHNWNHHY